MTEDDQAEAYRLCEVLRELHDQNASDSLKSEVITKAALAISHAFMRGLRPEIEDIYAKLDTPLSDAEKAKLSSMGFSLDE